jgi:hypothetical protein
MKLKTDLRTHWSANEWLPIGADGAVVCLRLPMGCTGGWGTQEEIALCTVWCIKTSDECAYPIWRSAARSRVRKLQVLQSKCLRIATNAPWYVSNRQIHEDLGILRRPHQSTDWEFRLKVSLCAEPHSSATWKAPVPTKGWLKSSTGNRGGLMFSRPAEAVPKKTAKSAQRVVSNYSASLTEVFRAFPQLQGKCQGIVQKGTARLPQSWRPSAEVISPLSRRGHQPKWSQHFWVQLPESHPTKILLTKNTLPDGTIFHQ